MRLYSHIYLTSVLSIFEKKINEHNISKIRENSFLLTQRRLAYKSFALGCRHYCDLFTRNEIMRFLLHPRFDYLFYYFLKINMSIRPSAINIIQADFHECCIKKKKTPLVLKPRRFGFTTSGYHISAMAVRIIHFTI